jgi:MraZ protein
MDLPFDGQADYNLDAKNRLTVPARFRGSLEGGVVLVKGLGDDEAAGCVEVWTPVSWHEYSQSAMRDVHPLSHKARTIKSFLNSNSITSALDSAGRIALPNFLMDHAGLGREVTVAGAGDHLQVWDRAAWTAYNKKLDQEMLAISRGFDDFNTGAR